MTDTGIREVIVIGSGPAGYAAALCSARRARAARLRGAIFGGGSLTTRSEVENFPRRMAAHASAPGHGSGCSAQITFPSGV